MVNADLKDRSVTHEKELCKFIDKINLADAKFMFSYILQSGDFHNYEVENWATKRGYNIIHIDETQGRYNDRKEVLITNYKSRELTTDNVIHSLLLLHPA